MSWAGQMPVHLGKFVVTFVLVYCKRRVSQPCSACNSFILFYYGCCSGCRPTLVAVDDILFQKPVEIGSLLMLSSQVGS